MPELTGWDRFDPNNPQAQLLMLANRVENLGREKEQLEEALDKERAAREKHEGEMEVRMAKIESSFQKGAGILMVLPVIGTIFGLIVAYGKTIFAPWTGK